MSRWFRMYDELLDDPKVQRLSGDEFKAWVNLLCLASRNDGALPPLDDIAFSLRLDRKKAGALVSKLVSIELIDEADGRFSPHGWNARQYKSDVSSERVKRFRKRSKCVSGTADETPPDTETETDSSEDKSSGTVVPLVDPEKVMFDTGINYLAGCGIPESKARPQLGKWKRDHGAGAVIEALGAAQRQGVVDPMGWIEGRWRADRQSARQPAVPL